MNAELAFWAQSLDNSAPDHMSDGGRVLAPDETSVRQSVVGRVSRVTREGERLADVDGVILTWSGDEFVLEITAEERDVAGREAPMSCHGQIPGSEPSGWPEDVLERFDAFAADIARSIPPDAKRAGIRKLNELQKKKRQRTTRRALVVAGTLAVVILLVVVFRNCGTG